MYQLEKNQVTLRDDVDVMKGKIDHILEALQALAKREDNPQ